MTENVGARDLLNSDVAVTVPIRNPAAIAEAIETARELPGERFDAARKVILATSNWAGCAERMIQNVYAGSSL